MQDFHLAQVALIDSFIQKGSSAVNHPPPDSAINPRQLHIPMDAGHYEVSFVRTSYFNSNPAISFPGRSVGTMSGFGEKAHSTSTSDLEWAMNN